MHHPTPYGANAYRAIGIETGVDATDPLGLVVMLYDGAIQAIVRAEADLAHSRIESRGLYTSKAIDIIQQGLSASLDMAVGGTLAESLWSLYEYMGRRLLAANMSGDASIYAEVRGLLADLRDSWKELRQNGAVTDKPAFESSIGRGALSAAQLQAYGRSVNA